MTTTSMNGYEIWPDADDECIAREDDNYDGPYGHGRCTCGRDALAREWDGRDGAFPYHQFDGCKGCDPTMDDCRPYKFGIELWECDARLAAQQGCRGCFLPGLLREQDLVEIVCKATPVPVLRRARAADIRWDRICSTVETHSQAVAAYTRWAKRTIGHNYRNVRTNQAHP